MKIHERLRVLGWISNCVNDLGQICGTIPNVQISISISYRIGVE